MRAVFELGSGRIALFDIEVNGTHEVFFDATVELLNQDGSAIKDATTQISVPPIYEGTIPEVVPTGGGGALVVGSTSCSS